MTKQIVPPSALDLFKQWHRRYERHQITLHRIGFSEDARSEHFSLRPWREGERLKYAHNAGYFPYVDVLDAELKAQFTVESGRGVLPFVLMEDEFWRLIQKNFLDGRRYFVRVRRGFFDQYYGVPLRVQPFFPAQFSTWPVLKRGMVLNPRDQEPWPYLHWSAFVPEGTPEHAAIAAANDLAEFANKAGIKPTESQIDDLKAKVFEKVKLVPA